MRRAVTLAAGLLPALAAAQPVATPVAPGGVLSIEGKQVPLPEGAWLRAGGAEGEDGVVSLALLQVRDGQVVGGVLLQANKAGAPSDWGSAPGCRRTDLPFVRVHYASDHDGACAYVAVVEAAPGGTPVDPAWAEASGLAAARGWTLPGRWAEAAIRVSDPLEAVQVRYAFALPAGVDLPPGLSGWTETALDGAAHGLLNQLEPPRALPPLEQAGPAPDEETTGGIPRPVWKTITFRMIATTIDFSTNVIAIGNLVTASLLSAWNTVTGPWIYLAHELAWDYFGAPAVTGLDLPGIGAEHPP